MKYLELAVLHVADQTNDPLLLWDVAKGIRRQPNVRDVWLVFRQQLWGFKLDPGVYGVEVSLTDVVHIHRKVFQVAVNKASRLRLGCSHDVINHLFFRTYKGSLDLMVATEELWTAIPYVGELHHCCLARAVTSQ